MIIAKEAKNGTPLCNLSGKPSQEAIDAAFERGFKEDDFGCTVLGESSSFWKPEYLSQLVGKRWFSPNNAPDGLWNDELVRVSLTTDGENYSWLPEQYQTKENFQLAINHGFWDLKSVDKEFITAAAVKAVFSFYDRNKGEDYEDNAANLQESAKYWLMQSSDSHDKIVDVVDEEVTYAAVKFDGDLLCSAQPRFKTHRAVLAAVEDNSSDVFECIPARYRISVR